MKTMIWFELRNTCPVLNSISNLVWFDLIALFKTCVRFIVGASGNEHIKRYGPKESQSYLFVFSPKWYASSQLFCTLHTDCCKYNRSWWTWDSDAPLTMIRSIPTDLTGRTSFFVDWGHVLSIGIWVWVHTLAEIALRKGHMFHFRLALWWSNDIFRMPLNHLSSR